MLKNNSERGLVDIIKQFNLEGSHVLLQLRNWKGVTHNSGKVKIDFQY